MTTLLDQVFGLGALRTTIDGRDVTTHSRIWITRGAGNGGPAQATLNVFLPAGTTWRPVRGMQVWIRLSDTALSKVGGAAQHRDRFVGRVTDVDVTRRRDGSHDVTVTAAGTRAQANRGRVPAPALDGHTRGERISSLLSRLSSRMLTSPAWQKPPGHGALWGLAWSGRVDGGSPVDAPPYWAPSDPTWGRLLDILADSTPRHVVSEQRGGALVLEETSTAPTITIPASLAHIPLEQSAAPLVNSSRVIYGQGIAEPDVYQRYQLYKNPNPYKSQSAFGYRNLYNAAPASVDTYGVKIVVTNAAGYSMFGVSSGMTGDPTATSGEYDTVAIHLVNSQTGGVGGWLVQVEALDSSGVESGWETIATTPSGTIVTTDVVWRIPPAWAKYGTIVLVRLRIPANVATADGGIAGRIRECGVTTVGYQHVGQDRVTGWGYFDGNTPARDGERYYWLGSAGGSYSVAVRTEETGSAIPRRVATAEDTSTWATVDEQGVEVETALMADDGDVASALSHALLTGAQTLQPPSLTVDVLKAARDGRRTDALTVLSAEVGHRIKLTGAPAGVDPSITSGTGAYVDTLTEEITPRSWTLTLTPALII